MHFFELVISGAEKCSTKNCSSSNGHLIKSPGAPTRFQPGPKKIVWVSIANFPGYDYDYMGGWILT